MNSLRKTILLVLIGLQACTFQQHEKGACRTLVAYTPLAAPPEDVELLYSLKGFGRPRPGYHEHWYQLSDDTLAACRHLKTGRGSCGTEEVEFVRTQDGWDISKPMEVIICAGAASQPPPSGVASRGGDR